MQLHQFKRRALVLLLLLVTAGALAGHSHELESVDDCCLCACGTCPEPGAASVTIDQPRPVAWHALVAQVPPLAPPVAAPLIRRGPPVSVV